MRKAFVCQEYICTFKKYIFFPHRLFSCFMMQCVDSLHCYKMNSFIIIKMARWICGQTKQPIWRLPASGTRIIILTKALPHHNWWVLLLIMIRNEMNTEHRFVITQFYCRKCDTQLKLFFITFREMNATSPPPPSFRQTLTIRFGTSFKSTKVWGNYP